MAVPTEPPPDVASASSSSLFCLRHLRLGLDLRPEARALAGCLVLELCARVEEEEEEEEEEEKKKRKLWTLVLDTHPALRVASVGFRPSPVGEKRCGFVFPSAHPPKEEPNSPPSSSPGRGVSRPRGTLRAFSALASGPSTDPTRPPLTPQDPPWSPDPSRPPLTPQDPPWSPDPSRPPLTPQDPPWSPDPSRPPLTPQDPPWSPDPSRPPLTPQDPPWSPAPSRPPLTSQDPSRSPNPSRPPLTSQDPPWSSDPSRPPLTSQDPSSSPDPSRPLLTPQDSSLSPDPSRPLLTPQDPSSSPVPSRPPSTPRKAHAQHPSPTLSSTHSDCLSCPSSGSRLAHDPHKAVADPRSSSGQACPLEAHHTALASSSAHPGCPSGPSQQQQGLHGDDPAADLKAFPFSDCSFFPEAPPPPVPTFPDPLALSASSPPRPLFFRVDPFTDYGSALTISLPSSLKPQQPFQVIIRYTTIDAPAIWWLDPELTYGNSKPFVFTQGHSVCNRSFFPCFDTPAVKCTYSAIVKAPAGMQVLMSATQSSYEEQEGIYQFYMEYPIPAYLVALVAGDLVPADIGPRSKVWAEPCLLSTAIGKLSGRVERWLSAAESLYGPYIWGRYDIVFLPPSFPMVAMENPCLTFIISSILESDEFLIIDVIHEVAHSWFGNAVTNATWEEMWLSEGLATYAQRRITTETYGAAFTCLETAFRLDALHRQMKLLGEDNPVSKLQVKLEPGVNPSNLMNLFTYEKGYCFVYYLSQLCGDPMRFDAFLRAYIEKYKFTSVVAQDLLDSFLAFFPELKEQCIDSKTGLEFERWLNATGPPLIEPDLSQGSSLTSPVETLFSLWTTEPLDAVSAANSVNITEWQTFQTVLFLDRLLDGSPLPHEVISKLSECYSAHLDSMNAEIRIRWLQIIVRNDYYPDLHKVRRFLENQMSRMYTIPLYEDLCTGTLKSFALEVFYQTQNQLHPNLRKTIQQILTQGLNPLLAMDTTTVTAEALAAGYEDRSPEAVHSAISLRDVNVSA